jgi:alpha-beta hydrolase superfamily lysophospholipase
MGGVVSKVLISLLISVIIYFGLATVFILVGKREKPKSEERSLGFHELFMDYSGLPALKSFVSRDGESLGYRCYGAPSDKVMILLHGSGWHSRYFLPLAEYVSSAGAAQVYTPDLRGHGPNPKRRGDLDYIGQFEDDLADLISLIRNDHPDAMLIIGGHSSGGGLTIRFAGGPYGQQADAFLLISPFLKYNAPTMRPKSGGWARAHALRIAGLTMLNNVGIHWFDHLTAIEFNMPTDARDGTETLSYTHRLNTAYAPRDYKRDLKSITQPLLVVAGTSDDAFLSDQFEPVIRRYAEAQVVLLEGVSHMGAVVGPEVRVAIKEWLEALGK